MQCSTCRREAVIFQPYSGRHLCGDHLILDLEAKAKRAIRENRWIHPGDHIGVSGTGGPSGAALYFFLTKLTGKRRDIRLSAIQSRDPGREQGITKIALATSLEDTAASALAAISRGDVDRLLVPSSVTREKIPVMSPFSHIPEQEIALYARLCGVERDAVAEDRDPDPPFSDIRGMLDEYTVRHPAAPYAVLNLCEALQKSCRNAHYGKE